MSLSLSGRLGPHTQVKDNVKKKNKTHSKSVSSCQHGDVMDVWFTENQYKFIILKPGTKLQVVCAIILRIQGVLRVNEDDFPSWVAVLAW